MKLDDPLFDPRCCMFRISKKIQDHVDKIRDSSTIESRIKLILGSLIDEDEANKNTITYDSLVELHKYISRADRDYVEPFYLFYENCKCVEPKPRDNKQLEARLKALRLKSSQSTYNKMATSVDRVFEEKCEQIVDGGLDNLGHSSASTVYSNPNNNTDGQTHLSEFKKLNGSMVAVFNSFLVFLCTFVFCYKALEYALPQPNIIAQVSFGLGGSTLVAIAELYFLIRVI